VTDPSVTWKLVFLSVFLLLSNTLLGAYFVDDQRLGTDPSIPVVSTYGYLLGGAFVGFGTRLGNGCTTGHGICGMARLSKRSIVAVCTFMLSAFATAAMISPDNRAFAKGTDFLRTDQVPELFNRWLGFCISMIIVIPTFCAVFNLLQNKREEPEVESTTGDIVSKDSEATAHASAKFSSQPFSNSTDDQDIENPVVSSSILEDESFSSDGEQQATTSEDRTLEEDDEDQSSIHRRKLVPAMMAATLFAVGLAVSQMVLPSKVLGFLALYTLAHGTYDPTLLTVMVAGAAISFCSYQFVKGWGVIPNNPYARSCPFVANKNRTTKFSVPTNTVIDWHLLIGALCFGIGWAVVGLCPGPAMFLAATGTKPVIFCWWPAFIVGSFVAQNVKDRSSST
jgi:uncharacterized membrane protein YedE/YeeE